MVLAVLGTLCLSSLNAAELKCKFQYFVDDGTKERFGYTCINNEELPANDFVVTQVSGDHLYRDEAETTKFTDADVEIVEIRSEMISQIPIGLPVVFPKLSQLLIAPKLRLTQRELFGFLQLTKLTISVDHIPDNLFDDVPNLLELILDNSGLTSIPLLAFEKLTQLEVLKVHGSTALGLAVRLDKLPANLLQNNLNLREILFYNNGLTCIQDGLFDHLEHLESVTIINDCLVEKFPDVTLSKLKEEIHASCQKCEVPITDAPPSPPPVTEVAPVSCPPGSVAPECLIHDSCPSQLKKLQEEYEELKDQKDCKNRNKIELIFKHSQNKK